ncbi:hypothetical protein BC937DRAFT_93787 [Endogone sp. FLAS-F59071]|nr:hypothetical protein BC937DRAFT_93787 [Endogone sp. FLAS-F59071]|eukprot:RUS21039.1 hypothetical protein BC937DRAFT_93787 [Endogone sp. FLAS-F59071]
MAEASRPKTPEPHQANRSRTCKSLAHSRLERVSSSMERGAQYLTRKKSIKDTNVMSLLAPHSCIDNTLSLCAFHFTVVRLVFKSHTSTCPSASLKRGRVES